MPTTTRGAFPYPAGADNWKMLRTAIQSLADRAAAATVLWRQTAAAARGNAGTAGTLHQASDTGEVALDTGSAWTRLLTEVAGVLSVGALRTTAQTSSSFGAPGVFDGTAVLNVGTGIPGARGLSVQGAANQQADLVQLRNSSGLPLLRVDATGGLFIEGKFGASTAVLTDQLTNVIVDTPFGLRQLQVGAPDSAGTGFRTVRVPN